MLQKIELEKPVTTQAIEQTIANLLESGLLESDIAERIEIQSIGNFFTSNMGQLLLKEPQLVKREVPFSMLMPVNELFPDVKTRIAADILIHGIIDAYIKTDKEVILLDYKTDYIGPGAIQKKERAD